MSRLSAVLVCAPLLAVAACGGSGKTPSKVTPRDYSTVLPAAEQAARVFSTPSGTMPEALKGGATLTARRTLSVMQVRDPVTGKVTQASTRGLSLKGNALGGVTANFDGRSYDFRSTEGAKPVGGKVYAYERKQPAAGLGLVRVANSTGTVAQWLTPGTRNHSVVNATTLSSSKVNRRTYAVIGTETPDDAMRSLGKVTYRGRARFDGAASTGYKSYTASNEVLSGKAVLNADFSAGTISGQVSELTRQMPGQSSATTLAGTIDMQKTSFAGNGYQGTLSATGAGLPSTTKGAYRGAFFGAKGQETAGVATLTYGTVTAQGYFSAEKK